MPDLTVGKTTTIYRLAVLVLAVVSLGLYLWRFDSFQVGTYLDDAEYIVLAESIVEGSDYGLIYGPGETLPTRYPFGWPLLLAPAYALAEGGFQALKAMSLAFTLANVVLLSVGWKHLGFPSRPIGLASAALYALSPMVVGHARMVMSEAAFLFFVLLGLVLTAKSCSESRYNTLEAPGLGAAWMCATYIRTIGLAFVVASLAYLCLKKRWHTLLAAVAGLMGVFALVLVLTPIDLHDLIGVQIYAEQFSTPTKWGQDQTANSLGSRIAQGVLDYLGTHACDSLVPFVGGPTFQSLLGRFGLGFLPWLLSGLVTVLLIAGYVYGLHEGSLYATHFYVPIYAAITVAWPWRGPRFLYGILPFMFAYLVAGGSGVLQSVFRLVRRKAPIPAWVPRLVAGGVALLVCVQLVASLLIDDSLEHVRDFRVGASWIREHADKEAVVVAEHPQVVYLYAERSTIRLPGDLSEMNKLAFRREPCYLLIAPKLEWSDAGELTYTSATETVLEALQSNALHGELVFADEAAMVQLYLLKDVAFSHAPRSSRGGQPATSSDGPRFVRSRDPTGPNTFIPTSRARSGIALIGSHHDQTQ